MDEGAAEPRLTELFGECVSDDCRQETFDAHKRYRAVDDTNE